MVPRRRHQRREAVGCAEHSRVGQKTREQLGVLVELAAVAVGQEQVAAGPVRRIGFVGVVGSPVFRTEVGQRAAQVGAALLVVGDRVQRLEVGHAHLCVARGTDGRAEIQRIAIHQRQHHLRQRVLRIEFGRFAHRLHRSRPVAQLVVGHAGVELGAREARLDHTGLQERFQCLVRLAGLELQDAQAGQRQKVVGLARQGFVEGGAGSGQVARQREQGGEFAAVTGRVGCQAQGVVQRRARGLGVFLFGLDPAHAEPGFVALRVAAGNVGEQAQGHVALAAQARHVGRGQRHLAVLRKLRHAGGQQRRGFLGASGQGQGPALQRHGGGTAAALLRQRLQQRQRFAGATERQIQVGQQHCRFGRVGRRPLQHRKRRREVAAFDGLHSTCERRRRLRHPAARRRPVGRDPLHPVRRIGQQRLHRRFARLDRGLLVGADGDLPERVGHLDLAAEHRHQGVAAGADADLPVGAADPDRGGGRGHHHAPRAHRIGGQPQEAGNQLLGLGPHAPLAQLQSRGLVARGHGAELQHALLVQADLRLVAHQQRGLARFLGADGIARFEFLLGLRWIPALLRGFAHLDLAEDEHDFGVLGAHRAAGQHDCKKGCKAER